MKRAWLILLASCAGAESNKAPAPSPAPVAVPEPVPVPVPVPVPDPVPAPPPADPRAEEITLMSVVLRFSVAGYALALLTSLLMLWLFGRTDDTSLAFVVSEVVVLGFPASVGAAAARLIL